MATKLEFPRGDDIHHSFMLPAANWSAGGKLFFAAKPAIDDDNTDENAVIDQNWDDDDLLADQIISGVTYKVYDCHFPPAATSEILSGGADSTDYLGEFQFVPSSGLPQTYPANNQKIDAIVYFDVKRKVVP